MNQHDEALLRDGLITPPEDFLRRTMARVAAAPMPRRRRSPAMREVAQWIALAGTALVGAMQIVSYVFGIWIVSSAG
jgi:hypothetical protein